jgi:hypothetical protein
MNNLLRRARRWLTSLEPLNRSDRYAFISCGAGLLGWLWGPPGFFFSYLGLFVAGAAMGMMYRDRQQRAHERRMAQLEREHAELMAEIQAMDFEALVRLNELDANQDPARTCPRCMRKTYNHTDIKEGYCGACHDWT